MTIPTGFASIARFNSHCAAAAIRSAFATWNKATPNFVTFPIRLSTGPSRARKAAEIRTIVCCVPDKPLNLLATVVSIPASFKPIGINCSPMMIASTCNCAVSSLNLTCGLLVSAVWNALLSEPVECATWSKIETFRFAAVPTSVRNPRNPRTFGKSLPISPMLS